MVIVQSIESSDFDGMPRSVINTGLADYELPPEQMPAQLTAFAKHSLGRLAKSSSLAISNDESATNTLMVRAADLPGIRANPARLRGQRILITVNTTVDYVLQNCLRQWNLSRTDVQVVNLAQAQILSAFSTGEGRRDWLKPSRSMRRWGCG
jgi:hypothetical protein